MRRFCVGDLLKRIALRYPKRETLIYSFKGEITHRLTLGELNEKVNRFSNALLELGIRKGDRVAIISHNCVQYGIYLYALMKIGAWITPLNFALKGKEIIQIINHAEPVAFLVEDELVEQVKELEKDMPSVKHYGMINLTKEKPLPEGWMDFDKLCSEKYSSEEPCVEIDYNDVATLMYTSGTEAMPKGVMNTHGNWYSALTSGLVDLHVEPNDVLINSIPLYHVAGQFLFIGTTATGAKIVMHHEPRPEEILQLIQNEKVTYLVYPPTVFINILKMGLPEDFLREVFSSVKKAVVFGALLPEAVIKRCMEIWPNIYWMNYYGQSEISPLGATLQHPDILRKYQDLKKKGLEGVEPIGQPHFMVEMKIVDENDKEVPPWTIGEIVVRSPAVMLGYYKEEEKTRETFRSGWHHTGDLGMMDEEGFVYFVDRKKDIVKSGGENVSSLEVEDIIFSHPKVADCAVVGLPHPRWMEAVTAFVVPKQGESIEEDEIIRFCKERLAGYKVPKKVIIIDEIPKNPSGKTLKRELRKQFGDVYTK
jgi:fatty-acyl-CoA synthase